MTRYEASQVIYKIINSGIIYDELEDNLQDIANAICGDSFDKCPFDCSKYCDECRFLEEKYN